MKQINNLFEFAGFRLDVKKRRLMRGEALVPLTPKEFDVLYFLLENRGRVVEKDELLDAVWKDTFVEEGTLTRNISWLRKKLAEHNENEVKIIETVPRLGYRFLPEVGKVENRVIIEEETVQEIQIEEIIEFDAAEADVFFDKRNFDANFRTVSDADRKALPPAPAAGKFSPLWIISVILIASLAALAFYKGYFSQNETKVHLAAKIAPFSGLPGRENSPAFSPDGKQMTFAWDGGDENEKSDVYVKLIGSGEPVRLTETETEEISPVFSPDGKSIAFVRILPTHKEIVMIPALGGAERKIYDRASYASLSFSPDGKLLAHANLDVSNGEAGIFTLNLETGERTRLTTPDAPVVDHTPRFSPDGKFIAFIRHFSSFKREIFVMPSGGGEPLQITSDDVRIYGLAWSADNRSLFFTSFRKGSQMNLWKISAEGGEAELIPTGGKTLQDLAISPDGKTIAFVEENADENIREITPERPARLLIRSTRADHSQQFSPDGRHIVFASDRTGKYEIWIADADGKNQRQLTEANGSAGSPRFSPDGKQIVYDAQNAGNSDIYVISVNGGAPLRLTENAKNNFLPAWSADGNRIFFISNRSGGDQMWRIPASGGEAVQITKEGAFEMFAAPDGKTVIYSKGGGKSGLWSVGIDGADEKPIPELAEIGAWRSWSVKENGVYYTNFNTQPPFHINFFDFTTRQTKKVADVEKPPLNYYSNLAVSPDGKTILYSQQDQNTSNIMLAELN